MHGFNATYSMGLILGSGSLSITIMLLLSSLLLEITLLCSHWRLISCILVSIITVLLALGIVLIKIGCECRGPLIEQIVEILLIMKILDGI